MLFDLIDCSCSCCCWCFEMMMMMMTVHLLFFLCWTVSFPLISLSVISSDSESLHPLVFSWWAWLPTNWVTGWKSSSSSSSPPLPSHCLSLRVLPSFFESSDQRNLQLVDKRYVLYLCLPSLQYQFIQHHYRETSIKRRHCRTEREKKLLPLSLVSCVKEGRGWKEDVSKCLMFLREERETIDMVSLLFTTLFLCPAFSSACLCIWQRKWHHELFAGTWMTGSSQKEHKRQETKENKWLSPFLPQVISDFLFRKENTDMTPHNVSKHVFHRHIHTTSKKNADAFRTSSRCDIPPNTLFVLRDTSN